MSLIIKYPCGHNNKFITQLGLDEFYKCDECKEYFSGREIIADVDLTDNISNKISKH
jgi:hypothetical protein